MKKYSIRKSPDLNVCDYIVFSLYEDAFDDLIKIKNYFFKKGITNARILLDKLALQRTLPYRFDLFILNKAEGNYYTPINTSISNSILDLEIEVYHTNFEKMNMQSFYSSPVRWAINSKIRLPYL